MQNANTIVLIGMMGVGKTSLGRALSKHLGYHFIDVDKEIVEREGRTIPEIFKIHGESYFRQLELSLMEELLKETNCIISTGGGAVINSKTASLIWNNALSVWIHSDIDVLLGRIGDDKNRPLLQDENPRMVLEKLEQERTPIYKCANIHVKSNDEPLEKTLKRLIDKINGYNE